MHTGDFVDAVVGLAGVLVAAGIFWLTLQRRREALLTTFEELHAAFWSDPEMKSVRAWLASEQAYLALRDVLRKRFTSSASVTPAEYALLDTLDKFLNLLLRAQVVHELVIKRAKLWNKLYFGFWLSVVVERRRAEVWQYIKAFYPDLERMLGGLYPEEKLARLALDSAPKGDET